MSPSLCGSFLTDRRSLVAFTWTLTTVLTLVAFILALVMTVHVHTHYRRLERYYEQEWEYNNNNNYDQNNRGGQEEGEGEGAGGEGGEEGGEERGASADGAGGSADREMQQYLLLAAMSSQSMTFVAVYTMAVAIGLSLYGSTAIIGFTSLRGVYIAPCFSSAASSKLKLGIFGGAVVFFANLLLVCAVIFGEVRVEDWRDGGNNNNNNDNNNNNSDMDDAEPYEVERIATILAVTCMFLSALYTIFAVLLFLYFGSDDAAAMDGLNDDAVVVGGVGAKPPLSSLAAATADHPRRPLRENFITMGDET